MIDVIKTRKHEIKTVPAGGLTPLYSDGNVNLIQCEFGLSPGFDHLTVVTRGFKNPFDAFEGFDLFEVDMPYGPDGGLILGKKIGFFRRRIVDLTKLTCIVAVSHNVEEKSRFVYALDFISRVNVALAGDGYMVALMERSGKVLEVLDHLPDEDAAYTAQKFLYDAAISMETDDPDLKILSGEVM